MSSIRSAYFIRASSQSKQMQNKNKLRRSIFVETNKESSQTSNHPNFSSHLSHDAKSRTKRSNRESAATRRKKKKSQKSKKTKAKIDQKSTHLGNFFWQISHSCIFDFFFFFKGSCSWLGSEVELGVPDRIMFSLCPVRVLLDVAIATCPSA